MISNTNTLLPFYSDATVNYDIIVQTFIYYHLQFQLKSPYVVSNAALYTKHQKRCQHKLIIKIKLIFLLLKEIRGFQQKALKH